MQRRLFLASLGAIALLSCSKATTSEHAASELKSLTVDEVATKLAAKDGKTFIYDANVKASWTKGHVPGATWIDDEKVTVDQLPADRSALLVFYCHDEA